MPDSQEYMDCNVMTSTPVDFRADSCIVRVTGRRHAAEPCWPWEWERTCLHEGRVGSKRRWLREREWPRGRPPGPARLRSSTGTLALRPTPSSSLAVVLSRFFACLAIWILKRGSSSPSTLVLYSSIMYWKIRYHESFQHCVIFIFWNTLSIPNYKAFQELWRVKAF